MSNRFVAKRLQHIKKLIYFKIQRKEKRRNFL